MEAVASAIFRSKVFLAVETPHAQQVIGKALVAADQNRDQAEQTDGSPTRSC